VILVLLLFVVGPPYLDPPEEYGVAVNFGTSEVGSGNRQPLEPVASKSKPVQKEDVKETTQESSKSDSAAEDLITEDSEESIAIKKAKEEAEAKAEAERIEREKQEAEEKKRREEAEKIKNLDNLINTVSNADGTELGSEGDDNVAGDKGQLDGNPYAPSYFGGSGPGKGGVGYGLGGRGKPSKTIYKQDCNEYGLVIVRIVVNRQGEVVEAVPGIQGTTNTDPCLLEPAKKIALSHKWPPNSKAPSRQIGFVSINFDVSQ
ncbi:MAG: energy transducer TonB, partial [Psychroserpens sp.]|nr:energy transducer TonB [Psychroserpens sp.]